MNDPRQFSRCRTCNAEVFWAVTTTDKKMPVDAAPTVGGGLVLTYAAKENILRVGHFDQFQDDAKRNRYTSHFQTCAQADQHRKAVVPKRSNRCPVCSTTIADHFVACATHWAQVPVEIRKRVDWLFRNERGSDNHARAVVEAQRSLAEANKTRPNSNEPAKIEST